jgi:hypothetical protein
VDTSNKTVTYTLKHGMTSHGINRMVLHHKRIGDMNEKEVRERYGKIRIRKTEGMIVNVQTFTEMVERNKGNNYKGKETTSYLITYGEGYPPFNSLITLYIPQGGKSILSDHSYSESRSSNSSWVSHRFGTCVNTSN